MTDLKHKRREETKTCEQEVIWQKRSGRQNRYRLEKYRSGHWMWSTAQRSRYLRYGRLQIYILLDQIIETLLRIARIYWTKPSSQYQANLKLLRRTAWNQHILMWLLLDLSALPQLKKLKKHNLRIYLSFSSILHSCRLLSSPGPRSYLLSHSSLNYVRAPALIHVIHISKSQFALELYMHTSNTPSLYTVSVTRTHPTASV